MQQEHISLLQGSHKVGMLHDAAELSRGPTALTKTLLHAASLHSLGCKTARQQLCHFALVQI
jgi:hypothetical protein